MKYAWRGSHDSQENIFEFGWPYRLLNSIYPKTPIEVEIMIFSTVKASGNTYKKILNAKNVEICNSGNIGGRGGGGLDSYRKSTVV